MIEQETDLQKAVKIVSEAAMNVLYHDAHSWSARPCLTCKTITALLKFDVGCVRFAKERQAK